MKNDLYTSGEYLSNTSTWHTEDSHWKAQQIVKLIEKNSLAFSSIGEIGCGAGEILNALSKKYTDNVSFSGYDISPQAINLAKKIANDRLSFFEEDLLTNSGVYFDILLVLDVFEHVPDYLGFISKCKEKANFKIFHIPLDLHVSSLIRNTTTKERYTTGHIHYFSADSALATLRDSGLEIVDYFYTNAALDLFKEHPSAKKAIANIFRWVVSRYSTSLSARIFGGYSLIVLTQ